MKKSKSQKQTSAKKPRDLKPKKAVKGGKQKSWNPANF